MAEVLFRFAQGSLHEYRTFNADPHPGNYRFHRDGTVTFLDFGLVKHFTDGEYGALDPDHRPRPRRRRAGTGRRPWSGPGSSTPDTGSIPTGCSGR